MSWSLVVPLLISLVACGHSKNAPAGDRAASSAACAEANAALTAGQVASAQASWDKAARLDPTNPQPFADRARYHWQIHQYKEAAEQFDQACTRDPKNLDLLMAQIQVRKDAGDNQKIEELSRKAVSLAPDNPKALVYLGEYLGSISDNPDARKEARVLLERAVKLAPAMPIPYVELGRLLERENLPGEAMPYLETAWALLHKGTRTLRQVESMALVEKRRAETAYALALCARRMGKKDEEKTWLARFREVDARIERRSRLTFRALAETPELNALVELATLDIETGGAEEAVPLVQRAQNLAPTDTRVLNLISRLKSTPSSD